MRYTPFLLLLLVAACGSSKPAPEPEPEPDAARPPALRTLNDQAATWDSVRGKDKRTLVVFSTLW